MYRLLTQSWFDSDLDVENDHHEHFDIFDTMDDAIKGKDPWNYCNFNDPGVGFPRDCGVNFADADHWIGNNVNNIILYDPTNVYGFRIKYKSNYCEIYTAQAVLLQMIFTRNQVPHMTFLNSMNVVHTPPHPHPLYLRLPQVHFLHRVKHMRN